MLKKRMHMYSLGSHLQFMLPFALMKTEAFWGLLLPDKKDE